MAQAGYAPLWPNNCDKQARLRIETTTMKNLFPFWSILIIGTCLGADQVQAADAGKNPETGDAIAVKATGVRNVGAQEFEKLRADKKNVVLDVRTPKEFAAGHIPGAVNIDFNAPDFEQKVAKLDPNKTYLVHCAGGVRSSKACTKLSSLKFPNLYNLDGGLKAWERAGNKTEK